jgi:cob(I)alamin adenosyltransferase
VAGLKVGQVKIYTKTGDAGKTGLIGGLRVPKNSPRIAAIGDIDELNASVGLARCASVGSSLDSTLESIQNWLFEAGAEIASPGEERFETIESGAIHRLETSIDEMTDELPELKNFILPGGTELAARLHVARSACRRAERTLLELGSVEHVREEIRVLFNRLADWLFVAARTANHLSNVQDVNWKRGL